MAKKVLLHICCGICASHCIEVLKNEGYSVRGIFLNSNIYPRDEYEKRKITAQRVAFLCGIKLLDVEYDYGAWRKLCEVYAQSKEGGKRCEICYQFRLSRVFDIAKENGFDYFTTTLTVSPHKKSNVIFKIAKKIGRVKFLEIDFKKKDGFRNTIDFAKKEDLYRQNYCGCEFSKR